MGLYLGGSGGLYWKGYFRLRFGGTYFWEGLGKDLETVGIAWQEAKAQKRVRWRAMMDALCCYAPKGVMRTKSSHVNFFFFLVGGGGGGGTAKLIIGILPYLIYNKHYHLAMNVFGYSAMASEICANV